MVYYVEKNIDVWDRIRPLLMGITHPTERPAISQPAVRPHGACRCDDRISAAGPER